MTAQTFIFVHDQQIVLDYIAAGKFSELPDLTYMFLGQGPVDLIEQLPNVVIARELPFNIEHLPNLVAWTGWYAIVENELIKSSVVNLFEYDINIVGKWEQPDKPTSYFTYPQLDEVWWNYNGIRPALQQLFMRDFSGKKNLNMTSNYTLYNNHVDMFVRYMKSAINDSKRLDPNDAQAGHIIERYCSVVLDVSVKAKLTGKLQHLYADSHGTQGGFKTYEQLKRQLV